MQPKFYNSMKLGRLLARIAPLRCLDIGARGAPLERMSAMAWALEIIGFEPDQEECTRLNKIYDSQVCGSPWASARFLPLALGRAGADRKFYIMQHRGASSFLPPIPGCTAAFGRPEYGSVEATTLLDTVPLDQVIATHDLQGVLYMKLDVEGLELEILQSAPHLLSSSLLALETEVAFMPTRQGQPTYSDIAILLRDYNLVPLGFIELHSWRRYTRTKYPRKAKDPVPFSKGQLVHGNMLFMKHIDVILAQEPCHIIAAAFIALTYGYLDHARALLQADSVRPALQQAGIENVISEIGKISRRVHKDLLPSSLFHRAY